MTDLAEYQFELEGVPFGIDMPVHLTEAGFKPSRGSFRTQDVDHPLRDGGIPGRDFYPVASWGFEMFANGDTSLEALQIAEELGTVWPTEELRDTPGMLVPLRYNLGGRTRVVYGRPRRWDVTPSNQLISGMLAITADFSVFTPNFYSDVEHSVTINQNGSTSRQGLRSPLRTPVRTEFGSTPTTRIVENTGDRPTWPILEFRGGVNPCLEIAGWRCRLLASLGANEVVTVDTRPWVASSTRGGAFVRLDRDSRLQRMSIPGRKKDGTGGRWAATLTNDSKTASPSCTIRWRDANSSL